MSTHFKPQDENYRERVRRSFARQRVMDTIGATLERVEPGEVEIRMPYLEELTQQHGFLHAGILSTALDSACGYAAFSLMPKEAAVLSIEFKINMLAPAIGENFIFIGSVLKAGRTVTVCQGEAFAVNSGEEKLVAQMTATMMTVLGKEGIEQ